MKKNNKGFSLVELIVVVLIIAIVAVALAPQVMKWVKTAGENRDTGNATEIKTCVQAALSEYLSDGTKIENAGREYYILETGIYAHVNDADPIDLTTDRLAKLIDETMTNDYPEVYEENKAFKVSISSTNVITVTKVDI